MCKLSASTVTADGAALGQALENLGEAVGGTVGTDLEAAGKGVIAATANWQEGTPLTLVEDAEQAAIAVLDAIPDLSPWADLASIVFLALNTLIANSQTQSTITGSVVGDTKRLLQKEATLNTESKWFGKAKMNHNPFESVRQNFLNTFNTAAKVVGVKEVYV